MGLLLHILEEAITFYFFHTPKRGDPEREEILFLRDQLIECRGNLKFRRNSPEEDIPAAAALLIPFSIDLHYAGKHQMAVEVNALAGMFLGFPPPADWLCYEYFD